MNVVFLITGTIAFILPLLFVNYSEDVLLFFSFMILFSFVYVKSKQVINNYFWQIEKSLVFGFQRVQKTKISYVQRFKKIFYFDVLNIFFVAKLNKIQVLKLFEFYNLYNSDILDILISEIEFTLDGILIEQLLTDMKEMNS